jgi:sugar diacid utilization regulator
VPVVAMLIIICYCVNTNKQKEAKYMLSLPEIKNLLTDRQLNVVAERVGIHSNTIYRLMKVEKADYDTIKKLSDYLEGQLENAKQ